MQDPPSKAVNTSEPSTARVYDYFLGGKDNFPPDRELADKVIRAMPGIDQAAMNNRVFLQRAVRFMAEQGIRQFIDFGAGIPTAPNVHEVARRTIPEARVVYIDHDPIVLSHGLALLACEGGIEVVEGDLFDPAAAMETDGVQKLIDWDQPVGILLIAVLHFISDHDVPVAPVRELARRAASGSYIAISHVTGDGDPRRGAAGQRAYRSSLPVTLRTRDRVLDLFDGMPLVEPGLVHAADWRPDYLATAAERNWSWAGIARKP